MDCQPDENMTDKSELDPPCERFAVNRFVRYAMGPNWKKVVVGQHFAQSNPDFPLFELGFAQFTVTLRKANHLM